MKKAISIMCLLALMLASCSSPKPVLTVFKDLQPTGNGEFQLEESNLTIRPQDELMITVTSTVPSASAPYNLPLSNPAKQGELKMSHTPTQQTYVVNKEGDINFPVLGKLHVAGLTTMQLTENLTTRIAKEVKDPMVRVELSLISGSTCLAKSAIPDAWRFQVSGSRFLTPWRRLGILRNSATVPMCFLSVRTTVRPNTIIST